MPRARARAAARDRETLLQAKRPVAIPLQHPATAIAHQIAGRDRRHPSRQRRQAATPDSDQAQVNAPARSAQPYPRGGEHARHAAPGRDQHPTTPSHPKRAVRPADHPLRDRRQPRPHPRHPRPTRGNHPRPATREHRTPLDEHTTRRQRHQQHDTNPQGCHPARNAHRPTRPRRHHRTRPTVATYHGRPAHQRNPQQTRHGHSGETAWLIAAKDVVDAIAGAAGDDPESRHDLDDPLDRRPIARWHTPHGRVIGNLASRLEQIGRARSGLPRCSNLDFRCVLPTPRKSRLRKSDPSSAAAERQAAAWWRSAGSSAAMATQSPPLAFAS